MAPSGPAPEMLGNDTSLSRPVSRRKLSSASTAPISVSPRFGASRSNQARKRVTAAPVRLARAGDLDRILDRLHHRDRVEAARHLAAGVADDARQRVRAGRLIEPHVAMR